MNNRINPHNPSVLEGNASPQALEYHKMKAQEQAEDIARRFSGSPTFLKMIAANIYSIAQKAAPEKPKKDNQFVDIMEDNDDR